MFAYLIKVSLVWFLLYGVYCYFLASDKHFHYNRIYLLTALAAGSIFPFFQVVSNSYASPLETWTAVIAVSPNPTASIAELTVATTNAWSWSNYLLLAYGMGVFVHLLLFGQQLWKLWTWYQQGQKSTEGDYILVQHAAAKAPFSFGPLLFISPKHNFKASELDYVLTHESAHIRQWHSLDMMILALLRCFYWFHPLLSWYQNALKDQHEFLADQAVLQYAPVKAYAQLLLEQSVPDLQLNLVHHLTYSQLKKRITMMTNNGAPRSKWSNYTLSILAFSMVFWMVACQKAEVAAQADKQENKTTKEITLPLNNSEKVLTIAEEMPLFPSEDCASAGDKQALKACSNKAMLQYIYSNIKYPEAAKVAGTEGMVVISFVVGKDGLVRDIKAVREVENGCTEEAIKVTNRMIEEKIRWTPGRQDGKDVAVKFNLPIRFKLK